ncbi:MAG: hypothetical protein M3495_12705 [Pseudomonadota bacterium]|nr:hypothetical protein [Pseudomonadota bacterium]
MDELEREGHRFMEILLHRCALFRGHVEGQIDRMADVARAHAVVEIARQGLGRRQQAWRCG